MAKKKIKIYTTFIRFWHWTQVFLLATLAFTGFAVHGTHHIIHFDTAVKVHNIAGIALGLLAFAMFFYYFTTGEWKQYKLNKMDILSQAKYYTSGILKGEPHPHKKTEISRLNPLQKITYLNFKILILPIMGITGTMYLYQEYFSHLNLPLFVLNNVAVIHTIGAYILVAFVIVHVYMTTTGHTITSHIKTMITGWEEIEEHQKEG
ncbi:MAG: cytochrome B [Anaerolineae bacterium]|jgi:formate dehydrogenase gamma subunit|nr:cytochrome B [Anaerolineae bacterium]MBT4309887.1 cytochrome B [Anaerolineae bacterium]MBT4457498.1 cytochrome B [Anaerolineae bacterium]MBT4843637.1 cytochrome B [Anaerolineae bacterium]MBT6060793.1 cytochrome B [Anaerolineae bacterium]